MLPSVLALLLAAAAPTPTRPEHELARLEHRWMTAVVRQDLATAST